MEWFTLTKNEEYKDVWKLKLSTTRIKNKIHILERQNKKI